MDRRKKRGARKKKTAGRKNTFNVVSTVVLLAAVCVFVFSAYQLVMMLVPYYVGGKEYDEIKELAIVTDDKGEAVVCGTAEPGVYGSTDVYNVFECVPQGAAGKI